MPDDSSMRIHEHPILGSLVNEDTITIIVDGIEIAARKGEPIASAVAAAGIRVHRYTDRYRHPRGIFCAIGQCTDCSMVVDGTPGVRTCITQVRDGMIVSTQGSEEEESRSDSD